MSAVTRSSNSSRQVREDAVARAMNRISTGRRGTSFAPGRTRGGWG